MKPALRAALATALLLAATAAAAQHSPARPPGNLFDEPFFPLSHAIPGCAVPRGPWVTAEEAQADIHWRTQSGVSCYLAGKCRLMNSYQYDPGIAERVKATFERDGRFDDSSVWAHVQRRMVTLMGCVKNLEQAQLLKSTVSAIDDVTGVIDQLTVGTSAAPPYVIAPR